jgi:hypothetical protein
LKKMRRRIFEVWKHPFTLFIFSVLSDKNQPSLPSASIIYTSTGNSILFLFFSNHFLQILKKYSHIFFLIFQRRILWITNLEEP